MSLILFLIVIAVLIFVHELGHFIVAKRSGIRVDEFAIGFPPRVLSFKKGETRYTLNLIPFGGFVKIFGENPDDPGLSGKDAERAFINQPKKIQALTLSAGVLFNVLFAWIAFSVALVFGIPSPLNYEPIAGFVEREIIVTGVLPDSPGATAGIMPGDRILFAEALGVGIQNVSSEDLSNFIAENGEEKITLLLNSRGETKSVVAVPAQGIVDNRAALGISLADSGLLKTPWYLSIFEGGKLALYTTYAVIVGLGVLIFDSIRGVADFSQIAGPVGIVGLVGQASSLGIAYLLAFMGFISINLAVLNLLPFPALDGGRLLFVGIESVIKRRLDPKIVGSLNIAGFAILILLMVLVTYNDIVRIMSS